MSRKTLGGFDPGVGGLPQGVGLGEGVAKAGLAPCGLGAVFPEEGGVEPNGASHREHFVELEHLVHKGRGLLR